jgi:hypothetical protein
MEMYDWDAKGRFIGQVALEAVDESDAIERHPQIIDVLRELADQPDLNDIFGGNGHDPAAFVRALAEGLVPYRTAAMEETPELIQGLALLAQKIREHAAQTVA